MTPIGYIDKNQAELVASLQEMVAIDTTNPPGLNYQPMVELLEKRCTRLGMKTCVHRVPDEMVRQVAGVGQEYPRYNLVARWDVGAAKTVHFNAHYDVVPTAGVWRHGDPFNPALSRGWLYGRGSGDMKGSIAALLMAIKAQRQSGERPAFNIECSFTADEETGGELGAGYVVRQGLVNADYAVVCEGAAATKVGCGHNGVLWLEVEVKGKAAHASSPEAGHNAFEDMAALVHHLQIVKKHFQGEKRVYRDFNGQLRRPTVNIGGVFVGGTGGKVNTVPAVACFSIDRRIVPNETLNEAEKGLRQAIERAAAKVPNINFEVRSLLRIEPCIMEPTHPLPKAFAQALQSARRRPAEFRSTTGFTDLHFFIEEAGLPGIGYGVKGEQAHGIDERVGVRDLGQTARTYAEFMRRGIAAD
jgi:succinyl-diaminopimelate desuccinylase